MSNPFNAVVDTNGQRDYTRIDPALGVPGPVLIKGGYYGLDETITLDQDGMHLRIEPSVIKANTGGILIPADNCYLEILPGVTIDNESSPGALALTISGQNNVIRCKGRTSLGNISITSTGHGTKIEGGGLGTIIESLYCAAERLVVRNCGFNNQGSGSGLDNLRMLAGGGKGKILYCYFYDAEGDNVSLYAPDCEVRGCFPVAADGVGIDLHSARNQLIGNHASWSYGSGICYRLNAGAHDNQLIANISSLLLQVLAGADDNILTGNTCFDISDASGTSLLEGNEMGAAACAVTGSATVDNPLESEIVAGGETLIFTLSYGIWRNPIDKSIFRGLFTGDHAEANSWNNEKATILADAGIVRTSDKIVTVTFQPSSYSITGSNEVVSIGDIPYTLLGVESNAITPSVTSFTITEGS